MRDDDVLESQQNLGIEALDRRGFFTHKIAPEQDVPDQTAGRGVAASFRSGRKFLQLADVVQDRSRDHKVLREVQLRIIIIVLVRQKDGGPRHRQHMLQIPATEGMVIPRRRRQLEEFQLVIVQQFDDESS